MKHYVTLLQTFTSYIGHILSEWQKSYRVVVTVFDLSQSCQNVAFAHVFSLKGFFPKWQNFSRYDRNVFDDCDCWIEMGIDFFDLANNQMKLGNF